MEDLKDEKKYIAEFEKIANKINLTAKEIMDLTNEQFVQYCIELGDDTMKKEFSDSDIKKLAESNAFAYLRILILFCKVGKFEP